MDKHQISQALEDFTSMDFYPAALGLWKALGYESQRQLEDYEFSFAEFQANYSQTTVIKEEKALAADWKKLYFLFQITDEELRNHFGETEQQDIFGNKPPFSPNLKSYLFAGIELSGEDFSRTKLADLARQINRCYAIPLILTIKYGAKITIAVVDRRINKVHKDKDVLEKVTLIKDIDLTYPHRAHIEILYDLAIENLSGKYSLHSFDDLHKAWREVLDIKELNKAFYRKVAVWYQNALGIVKIPFRDSISAKDREETTKNFLVKLLCRMMFCWFLKEKGLIDRRILELVNYSGSSHPLLADAGNPESNSYYRGILRTLFFECLNEPTSNRQLKKGKYLSYLSKAFDPKAFSIIPYLNGGIFDREDEFFENFFYLDDNVPDSLLSIPNKLFYGADNLQGINQVFNCYKFTTEESTPLDEEIALDPELLGMVFENLLAELDPDPDVAKNARKNSGSYYTPREVIEFMVNDALVLYLENKAKEQNHPEYSEHIRFLVYLDTKNSNTPEFDEFIVHALDHIKILDPACGSGAFPMGMLHKISALLALVDKDNTAWLNLKLKHVEDGYKDEFKKNLSQHYDGYSRKLGILRDSIYGLDIQPLAAHIAKLRFFISLIVDQKTDAKLPNYGVTPLPNLETNILCVNSLNDREPVLFDSNVQKHLTQNTQAYYKNDQGHSEKDQIAELLAGELSKSYSDFHWVCPDESTERKKEYWKRWFKFGNITCPFFHMEAFFPSVEEQGGFDIVIGNPPYGGFKIDEKLRKYLGIDSKDPYGAFIAKFLRFKETGFILKPDGILSYIVSDTFMTLKSHKALRSMMLENYIHKMIRMHPDTFKQVVNTVVFLCQKTPREHKIEDSHQCLMVDMTNISIHKNYEKFQNIMYSIEDTSKVKRHSDKTYAIFKYSQNIIHKCSLKPFFVAPEKFFTFIQDIGVERDEKDRSIRYIEMNGKRVGLKRLGDIASVTQGLATGDNARYLFQTPESGSRYRNITPYHHLVLSESDLEIIAQNENVRHKIIDQGLHKSKDEQPFDPDRWFAGKYIVPYDKGAASDTDAGWLPNYYVKPAYFIDWSGEAVQSIKTLTIGQRDSNHRTEICSRFQNTETYFLDGISFSITGMYAPTFRLNSRAVYDVKGSLISGIHSGLDIYSILGILCSKLIKFISKAFIYHTVDMQVDAIKEIPIVYSDIANVGTQVIELLELMRSSELTADNSSKIDLISSMVNSVYALNSQDVKELEDWYARRYPKLAGYESLDN